MLKEGEENPADAHILPGNGIQINILGRTIEMMYGMKYFVHFFESEDNTHVKIAEKLAEKSFVPVIFTREKRDVAVKKYPANSEIFYFDSFTKKNDTLSPKSLDFAVRLVSETKHRNFFVIVDCLDYLMTYNERKEVILFVEKLFDAVSSREAFLIIPLCLPLFERREILLLERFGDVLSLGPD
ncbi:MAG: DUF835 domain-containing protein [Thermoplasmata archaeon]